MTPRQPLFFTKVISATLGATQLASNAEISQLLNRHFSGDWGELDPEDAQANDHALKHGDRILSSYTVKGEKLWVITEADRSATIVLTPGEY